MTAALAQQDHRLTDVDASYRKKQWLEARRKVITGTDLAELFGVGRHGPMKVWLDKTGRAPLESIDNDAMRFGRRFERPILEEYADRQSTPLTFADPFAVVTNEGMCPRLGVTLDARRCDNGWPVDAKNIGFRKPGEWGEDGSDIVPLNYALQMTAQRMVLGADMGHLAVLFNRYEFCVYPVARDPDVEERVIERIMTFWEKNVQADTPPTIDGTESYSRYIISKYATQRSKAFLPSTPALQTLAGNLHATVGQIDELEATADAMRNTMKEVIGEQGGIEGPNWRATWTQAKESTKVDWEAVARNVAQGIGDEGKAVLDRQVQAHTTTKPGSRRFTFNWKD
ncbi:MAG TPA: YqaJ viral recombinase family protein [Thermoanaerobaculia bacterium]